VRTLRAWGGALNLVFCNTKADCAEVARHLQSEKIVALALHGDLDQAQRNQVLVRFSNRSASVLVATDVAARGLDVKDIDAVFNYELPQQPEVYVHRIGRTGRAGKTGIAVSLVEEREMWRLQEIEKSLPDSLIQQRGIPDAKRGDETLVDEFVTIIRSFEPELDAPLRRMIGPETADFLRGVAELGFRGARFLIDDLGASAKAAARDRFVDETKFDAFLKEVDELRLRIDRLAAKIADRERRKERPDR